MEKLHRATICLLRYGGMHPFKPANCSSRIRISVGLLLWTVFLQIIIQTANVYFLKKYLTIASLRMFLVGVFHTAWVLATILIPIHFLCHAKKIAAVNSKLGEIVRICSINGLKMNFESKLRIFLLILSKIIMISINIIMGIMCEYTSYKDLLLILHRLIIYVADAIISLMFVIYLTILTEYFRLNEARIAELFARMRFSIEYYDNSPTNPLSDDTSILPQQSLYRQYSINAIKTLPGTSSSTYLS